jgi:hypothetical protein
VAFGNITNPGCGCCGGGGGGIIQLQCGCQPTPAVLTMTPKPGSNPFWVPATLTFRLAGAAPLDDPGGYAAAGNAWWSDAIGGGGGGGTIYYVIRCGSNQQGNGNYNLWVVQRVVFAGGGFVYSTSPYVYYWYNPVNTQVYQGTCSPFFMSGPITPAGFGEAGFTVTG